MIITIKDGVRSIKAGMCYFKQFLKLMVIKMVAAVLLFYNLSIPTEAVSATAPLYKIMTGKVLNINQDCNHLFGGYVHILANIQKEKSNDTDVL